jgi:CRP-like cAMP-binding protein
MLDGLSDADFAVIAPFLTARDAPRDSILYEEGAAVEEVCFPTGAVLSVISLTEDGRGVETCTIGYESAYGLLAVFGSRLASNRVIIQAPGRTLHAPAHRLAEASLKRPALLQSLVRHLEINALQVEQTVACNALHDVQSRLCRWILLSADRVDAPVLPLTQEALAYMLGVQRTTVTAAAVQLQAGGMISYRRGEITITDRAKLEATVCECYFAVRDKVARLQPD